jgi:hypothetical protein
MFADIVKEINIRARRHRIGSLQDIRKELKQLAHRPGQDLFSRRTTFEDYAFHHGGRTELQFNLGLEVLEGSRHLRHGVAFSFELSQTLPDIGVLVPKVGRFNEFLRVHPDEFQGMRMWYWKGNTRSTAQVPSQIPQDLIAPGIFVFLGRMQRAATPDYEAILDDFDRLLPLYRFVEGTANFPVLTPTGRGFCFQPGCTTKPGRTTSNVAERQLDVDLQHNRLQQALYRVLSREFGPEAVGTELPSGTGGRVDAVVRQGGDYWFYEIKTALSARACVREALAQLLDYSYWPGGQEASVLSWKFVDLLLRLGRRHGIVP